MAVAKVGGGLSAAALNIERWMARAGVTVAARGKAYYQQSWRLRIAEMYPNGAAVLVQGGELYRVDLFVEERGSMMALCNCAYADAAPTLICKHKVAAARFLRDYLNNNVSDMWEEMLTKAVRSSRKASPSTAGKLLFYSLQPRGVAWSVQPYTLPTILFPESSLWHDPEMIAKIVADKKLLSQAESVQPYGLVNSALSFLNATRAQAALVKMVASSGVYYGHGYNSPSSLDFDTFFTLLAGGPLYMGSHNDPLKQPLSIVADAARIEMEMKSGAEGIGLRPIAVAQGQTFSLHPGEMKVVTQNPLWVISGSFVLHLNESYDLLAMFERTQELRVPAGAEQVFVDKHLTPLAERFPAARRSSSLGRHAGRAACAADST
ncbi:MAG: hypothetical protein WKF84_30335 [Pyrinomonadaceae bacterium]